MIDNTYRVRIGEKKKLTLSVDKNLVEKAKEMGINISAFLEEKLAEVVDQSKTSRRRDLNPRPGDYKSPALPAKPRRLERLVRRNSNN